MTTSVNPLKPVQVRDKNGHMVTRWVRVLEETGERAIVVPPPAVPSSPQLVESTMWRLFPEFDEEAGCMTDIFSQEWGYSDVFTRHALGMLPTKTMTRLSEEFSDDSSAAQCHTALVSYQYLNAMAAHGSDEDSQEHYDVAVARLNNALMFREVLNELTAFSGITQGADDTEYVLAWAMKSYEDPNSGAWKNGVYVPSRIDYSVLPKREREQVIAYLVAFRVNQYVGIDASGEDRSPEPDYVDFIRKNLDRRQEIMAIVKLRRTNDVGLLQEMLSADAPALVGGVL
jgi:hypothetical protein